MAQVDEIAPDLFRICTYAAAFNLQFCQFLVRDDEPLLFHTGLRSLFPDDRSDTSPVGQIAAEDRGQDARPRSSATANGACWTWACS